MTPEDKQKATALVRAAVSEDEEAAAYLLHEPPTQGLLASLAAMAASVLEETHGTHGALHRLDGWARLALAEASVSEESEERP